MDKYGRIYVNFSPAVSRDALRAMRQTIRSWHLQLMCDREVGDLSRMFNPVLRGWMNYYGRFCDGRCVEARERIPDPVAEAQVQEAGPS